MPTVDKLFHYCSTESFLKLVQGRKLWLSALKLSNDTMEGRLVTKTVMRLAERDRLDLDAQHGLSESLLFIERFFEGLGFCLSEEDDLLSQWRGYADNAQGVAIGFSRTYLEKLATSTRTEPSPGFSLHKVEYETQRHEEMVEATYRELKTLTDTGVFKKRGYSIILDTRSPEEVAADDKKIELAHRDMLVKLLEFLSPLYEMKSRAFREEKEWRLVSLFIPAGTDDCKFRASRGRIVPFRSFELKQRDEPAITDVVLGPRHETPTHVVESMLNRTGFDTVKVRKSEVSYR
jgi:hypothetical protein